MAINKAVDRQGNVLMDLTGDSVTSDKMTSGTTAHNRAGESITGSLQDYDGDYTVQENGTLDSQNKVFRQPLHIAVPSIGEEVDPVFTEWKETAPAAGITSDDISNWNNKVSEEDVAKLQIVVCYDQSGVAHTYKINMQEVNI